MATANQYSPFGLPSAGVSADNPLAPEYLALERQKKIADLLMQKGQQLPEGQMVSGHYVAPSWTQQLGTLANAYMGGNMAEQNEARTAKLADLLRGQNVTEAQDILNSIKTNPQEALMKSVQARGQFGQTLAPQLVSNMFKEETPLVLPEGGTAINRKGEVIATGKDKQIETPSEIKAAAFRLGINPNPATWTPEERVAIDQKILQDKKAGTPNMTSITNVQAFEPFANKVQSKLGEGLVENYQALKNIPTQIKSLEKAAELAPKSFAGSMAEQKLATVKFFNNNLGTNIAPDKVKNTEELRSALFTNVMENLKKLDASPSQQQQQILQQSMGSIGTDPSAIPRVVEVYKQILVDKAMQHNMQVKQAQEGPAKLQYPYDISIPLNQGNWRVK